MYLGMPSLEAEEVDIRSMLEFVRNGEDEVKYINVYVVHK